MGNDASRWAALLSDKRLAVRDGAFRLEPPGRDGDRSAFEADCERLIFSAPLRRLAGKTQVHPFASVDFIHNRLTHSLEVASVARSLARRAGRFLLGRPDGLADARDVETLGWVAQAAGLAHDIGNPPYGHAGEAAIQAWAREGRARFKGLLREETWIDFERFDGNAQAFRMASRPDLRPSCHFRLTAATLGALVKYPAKTKDADPARPKSAAFSTEEACFDLVMGELGLLGRDGAARHPLSYLTEAADDICYSVSDFEDAVAMGLLDGEAVKGLFLGGMGPDDRRRLEGESLSRIRAVTIRRLVDEFASLFEARYEAIARGRLPAGGLAGCVTSQWGEVLRKIKALYEQIFSSRKKLVAEIGSYGQIARLLDRYFTFLEERAAGGREYERMSFLSRRLVTLAWGPDYYRANAGRDTDWWAHAVLDYVVGMTDSYLHGLAEELC